MTRKQQILCGTVVFVIQNHFSQYKIAYSRLNYATQKASLKIGTAHKKQAYWGKRSSTSRWKTPSFSTTTRNLGARPPAAVHCIAIAKVK